MGLLFKSVSCTLKYIQRTKGREKRSTNSPFPRGSSTASPPRPQLSTTAHVGTLPLYLPHVFTGVVGRGVSSKGALNGRREGKER